MKRLLISMIKFYRRRISPMTPPCCRFIPTCSQYALEAIEKYGALKGGWLALRRLSRCHPFHFGEHEFYADWSWKSGVCGASGCSGAG